MKCAGRGGWVGMTLASAPKVESSRLWGAQTQRSIVNIPIGGPESKMPLQIVHAFGTQLDGAAEPFILRWSPGRVCH